MPLFRRMCPICAHDVDSFLRVAVASASVASDGSDDGGGEGDGDGDGGGDGDGDGDGRLDREGHGHELFKNRRDRKQAAAIVAGKVAVGKDSNGRTYHARESIKMLEERRGKMIEKKEESTTTSKMAKASPVPGMGKSLDYDCPQTRRTNY